MLTREELEKLVNEAYAKGALHAIECIRDPLIKFLDDLKIQVNEKCQ